MGDDARRELEGIFSAALGAVEGHSATRRALARDGDHLVCAGRPLAPGQGVLLLAMGKAAAAMAQAAEAWAGPQLRDGLVITKDGHGLPLQRSRLIEAGHPVPDARSQAAGRRAIEFVSELPREDLLLVLISGGTSSLISAPVPGVDAHALIATTSALLRAGADIEELNTVRRHLSATAGGRLAQASSAARIEVLGISDVPDDRIDLLGSGPFAADPSRFEQALAIVERRLGRAHTPEAVLRHLLAGVAGEREETPKPGSPELRHVHTTLVARNRDAIAAARDEARTRGLEPVVLDEPLAGEARDAARTLVEQARVLRSARTRCLIAGGETTVTVRGTGRGGRNQELALAAVPALSSLPGSALLAGGTDGTDGPTDAAGAFADDETLQRAERAGLDPDASLAENDAYGFFKRVGGLIHTGPTHTNVMDLVLIRIPPASSHGIC